MGRFALKIDLSEVLKDQHHQKIMILVDPEWPNVSEIRTKITNMFNIQKQIGFKSLEGFFIPLEEPVEILKYVNMLIAFRINESTTQENQTQGEAIEPEILPTVVFAAQKKKRKYGFLNEENFTTSTPNPTNIAKRLKSVSTTEADDESLVESRQHSSEKRKKKKGKSTSPGKALKEISNQSKNKNGTKKSFRNENEMENSKSFDNESKTAQSKTVSDSENLTLEENNAENQTSKMEIIFLCELTDSELTGRGRCFQIGKHATSSDATNEQASELELNHNTIVENVTIQESFLNSVEDAIESVVEESTNYTGSHISCDDSAVIESNETQCKTDLTTNQESECSYVSPSAEKKCNESSYAIDAEEESIKTIPLTDLPNLKDKITFKIMLTNNKLSEDFVGICEYVNKRTKSIKLRLLDGIPQLRYLPQKYAGNFDDSDGLTILNVKLQEMFAPKVILT